MGTAELGEPCLRCPPFVVRCGHLGEVSLIMIGQEGASLENGTGLLAHSVHGPSAGAAGEKCTGCATTLTRAEADAEFARREEALLR